MQAEEWRRAHSSIFYLAPDEPEALSAFLTDSKLLHGGETLERVEKAGDGNMNCTVRVTTNERSFIVKQARPWVEKYPQFEAPWDRAIREMEFYELVRLNQRIAKAMPTLIHSDPESRLIILEDLGTGGDYTTLYRGDSFAEEEISNLADYLSELHTSFVNPPHRHGLANHEMRDLNSQHIFFIPLQNNSGLNLAEISPGLQTAADQLIADKEYVTAVHALARVYMSDGDHLLHGDFFPGSFLKTQSGPRVIDPEFAYFGRPEFDPAVFIAHLLLGRQPPEFIELFLRSYRPPKVHDEKLMLRLAGVEVMRRLIGYAQLPLGYGGGEREELLEISRQMVLRPDRNLLTTCQI